MRLTKLCGVGFAILMGLGGCSSQTGDTWPAPEKRAVTSAIQLKPNERLLLAVTSSGGGAGDITYRLLNCKNDGKRCELLASIDTNDNLAPALSRSRSGISLVVNIGDYVADFRNFSREIGSLQPGELSLQYRADVRGLQPDG